MKRSFLRLRLRLRLPFFTLVISLLIFISLAALLAVRAALPRSRHSPAALAQPNATLVRLASADVDEAELRRAADELLEGSLQPLRARYRYRYLPLHRTAHPEAAMAMALARPAAIRLLRSPKELHLLPEFRRSLRDWLRLRSRSSKSPDNEDIMSQLIHLVKAPIDRYNNNSHNSTSRYGSCAVVGNSGILLRSERGDAIDAHDLVIRLNNARTVGYARNVGSKTGLSFVNSNILHSCARRPSCRCHTYARPVPILMYLCQPAHLLDCALCNNASFQDGPPLLVTHPALDLLCARLVKYYSLKRFAEETGRPPQEWSSVHDERAFHYSSGMQAVMIALGICDRVSVFGFGKDPDAKHHYHTNQKAELNLHDYEAEYALYRHLMHTPQLVPFLTHSFKLPPLVFYH